MLQPASLRRCLAAAALLSAFAGCHAPGEASFPRRPHPPFALGTVTKNAIDERWKPFAGYLDDLVDRTQSVWAHLLFNLRQAPKPGTQVTVHFRLDRHGRVTEIVSVEGGDEAAARPCVAAIARQGTFGEWTPEMIAKLGDSQEITFIFVYE